MTNCLIDYVGQKFERLVITGITNVSGRKHFVCKCDCGNLKTIKKFDLISGKQKSCGCKRKEIGKSLIKDITGQRFGRLVVTSFVGTRNAKSLWNCLCDCGNESSVGGANLTSGGTSSCGCILTERIKETQTKHGHTAGRVQSKTYRCYWNMISRCTREDDSHYKNYGGRGIKICDRWMNGFEFFLEDMGEAPIGKSIDRIDVDKGYEKGNCRWASPSMQARNKTKITGKKFSEYRGVGKQSNKFTARIRIDGKLKWLGSFENEIDAAKAYDSEAIKHIGFLLNFPVVTSIVDESTGITR